MPPRLFSRVLVLGLALGGVVEVRLTGQGGGNPSGRLDGDFGLSMDTLTATTVEGRCILGGPDCRFTMTRH